VARVGIWFVQAQLSTDLFICFSFCHALGIFKILFSWVADLLALLQP